MSAVNWWLPWDWLVNLTSSGITGTTGPVHVVSQPPAGELGLFTRWLKGFEGSKRASPNV